jgi:hypothetical protein
MKAAKLAEDQYGRKGIQGVFINGERYGEYGTVKYIPNSPAIKMAFIPNCVKPRCVWIIGAYKE